MIKIIKNIINDTLKKRGEWDKTALTMFSSWLVALFMAFHDLYKTGFKFEVFIIFVAVALGVPVTSAISKRIHPPLNDLVKEEKQ